MIRIPTELASDVSADVRSAVAFLAAELGVRRVWLFLKPNS